MVAHDEVFSGGNDHLRHGTDVVVAARHVGLVEGLAVDPHAAVIDKDGVAGQCDHALDVALLRIAGIMEDDHVAASDLFEVKEELVDEETILIAQLGLHAGAFHTHRLVKHGDDEEGSDDRDAMSRAHTRKRKRWRVRRGDGDGARSGIPR